MHGEEKGFILNGRTSARVGRHSRVGRRGARGARYSTACARGS